MTDRSAFLRGTHFPRGILLALPTDDDGTLDSLGVPVIIVDKKCQQRATGLARLLNLHHQIGLEALTEQLEGEVTWDVWEDPQDPAATLARCDWSLSKPFRVELRLLLIARNYAEQWPMIATAGLIGLMTEDTADSLVTDPPGNFAEYLERCVLIPTRPSPIVRELAKKFDLPSRKGQIDVPRELREAFGGEALTAEIRRRILPETDCATCQHRLGDGWVAAAAQRHPIGDGWLIDVHHRRCHRPELAPDNGLIVMTTASSTYLYDATVLPSVTPRPTRWWRRRPGIQANPVPLIIVNPAIDAFELALGDDGSIVDLTIERLRDAGWQPFGSWATDDATSQLKALRTSPTTVQVLAAAIGVGWTFHVDDRDFWTIADEAGGIMVLATHSVVLRKGARFTLGEVVKDPAGVALWARLVTPQK